MNKLNSSQQKAVAHLSGPMMVLAGPGSGKTSVIVERITYMTSEAGIDPASILVVTFSRAAAKEMQTRYQLRRNYQASPVTFGTLHGVFYGILKQSCFLGSDSIIKDQEQKEIIRSLTRDHAHDLSLEKDFIDQVLREISLVKNNRIPLDHYYSASMPDEIFRKIYLGYEEKCHSMNKIDFDDILLNCYRLLKDRPDILDVWQKKFKYILVDEFQDINLLQYDIIRMLALPENNLFIVGDDDQSIYHFRGSKPEIMRAFPTRFPQADQVLLDVNYRCTPQILKASQKLIRNNENRFPKKLHTPNPKGSRVLYQDFPDEQAEYRSLIDTLKERQGRGEDLKDTAILFRTNQETEGLLRSLMENHIPFYMKEKLPDIFEHWIYRDLLAYMHLEKDGWKEKDLTVVMNRPKRYISWEAIQNAGMSVDILIDQNREKEWMTRRLEKLKKDAGFLKDLPPFAAINYITNTIGYQEYLQDYAAYRKMNSEDLTEILYRLSDTAKHMKTLEEWEQSARDYEADLKLHKDRQKEQKEGVTISTLHGSKGLEFDKVYILNVVEGNIPYKKAILPEDLEEERRLFYVGMTRAKKELTLCSVRSLNGHDKETSRFIEEAGV